MSPIQSLPAHPYIEAQQILTRDLPSINPWRCDMLAVHNRRLVQAVPSPSGSDTFLETAPIKPD